MSEQEFFELSDKKRAELEEGIGLILFPAPE